MAPGKDGDRQATEAEDKPTGVMTPLVLLVAFIIIPFYIVAKTTSGNWDLIKLPNDWMPIISLPVSLLYICWLFGQCVIYMVPFGGEVVKGLPLAGGHRLTYRLNGFFALLVNVVGFVLAIICGSTVSLVVDYSIELVTISVIVQIGISVILYMAGKPKQSYNINTACNRGSALQDWLLGQYRNPRISFIDLKFVLFRSATIGSVLYNFAVLAKSYDETENYHNYTLLLAVGMQLMYVADTLWFESNLLSLKEIYHDGCGCITLVATMSIPFGYSLATRYIASTNKDLPWYCLMFIAMVFLIGYWIYRGSNNEKTMYRQNPNDVKFKDYETISTSTGRNLLVSGWWGMSRHPNYFGDIILNLAMCLPAGFSHFLPYFYSVSLTFMLIDRERNDYEDCKKKYVDDWDHYCHRVKYRIVPYVY